MSRHRLFVAFGYGCLYVVFCMEKIRIYSRSNLWIESRAQDLLNEIKARHQEFSPRGVSDPIDLLDPLIVSKILQVEFRVCADLGRFGHKGDRFAVAGSLDRNKRLVCVSAQFPPEEQRFTAAHEFGHFQLHPDEEIHRDRLIKGLSWKDGYRRPQKEREADYFAGCLLMPQRFVRREFTQLFGRTPLRIDDNLAWYLDRQDSSSIARPYADSIQRELALASVTHLGGGHFPSLAERFRVSVPSMAIRIWQLGLVAQ